MFNIKIHILSNSTNQNTTLHIEVEKMSMIGLTNGKEQYVVNGKSALDANRVNLHSKWNPPGYNWRSFTLDRKDVSTRDIINLDLQKMPGFLIRWYYTGGNATTKQLESKYNSHHNDFIR